MSLGTVTALIRDGVFLVLKLSSPILIAALVVGLIVAIIQAVTSIQEQTLTFVPKLLVILIALVLLGSWMFASLRSYTINLFEMIPENWKCILLHTTIIDIPKQKPKGEMYFYYIPKGILFFRCLKDMI